MTKTEQLQQLIDYYSGGNKSKFAEMLKITPQGLSSWMARDTFDAEKIYANCVNINAGWILNGEGPMLQSSDSKTTDAPITDLKTLVNELLTISNSVHHDLEEARQLHRDTANLLAHALDVYNRTRMDEYQSLAAEPQQKIS